MDIQVICNLGITLYHTKVVCLFSDSENNLNAHTQQVGNNLIRKEAKWRDNSLLIAYTHL